MSNKWLFIISLILMTSVGCAGGAFKTAQEKNTVEAYNKFIQEYGDSKFAPQAKKIREDLRFKNAKQENTISGYDRYLEEYPKGAFVLEAQKLRETAMFNYAKESNTVSAYDAYLEEFPNGAFVLEAQKLRQNKANKERLEQETLESIKTGDVKRLKQLISEGADVTDADFMNVAVDNGFTDMVELLIPYTQNSNLNELLYVAAYHGHKDIALLLIKHGGGWKLGHSSSTVTQTFKDDKYVGGNKEYWSGIEAECSKYLKSYLPEHLAAEFTFLGKNQDFNLKIGSSGLIKDSKIQNIIFEMIEIEREVGVFQILLGKCTFAFAFDIDRDNTFLCPPAAKGECLPKVE